MSLKFKLESKNEIPTGQESFYLDRDCAFFLDAKGVAEKSKHDESRTNNLALLKTGDAPKKKY